MTPLAFAPLLLAMLLGLRSLRITQQGNSVLIERLGTFSRTLTPGINVVVPFLEKEVSRQSLKERVLDVPPQPCITKDKVSILGLAVRAGAFRAVSMGQPATMPSLLLPALVTGGITIVTAALGAIWLEIKASRRELREDMKEVRDNMREVRAEYRSGIQALGEKVDGLVESLLTAR